MKNREINVAVVGVGFGGAFVPIYHAHPDVNSVKVYDIDKNASMRFFERGMCDGIYESFEDILKDETCDAVHLVTPIPYHAEQTVQVLEAGKHCACTVPMATSLEDIQRIGEAQKKSGKKYMMMETTLYTYHYFYVKNMLDTGKLGRIQFLRGSHYQDMRHWPDYWMGLPPMWYGTHAISPMVGLSGARIKKVHAYGSGHMAPEMSKQYGNPYPVETAIFSFSNGLKGEATRSLFECARAYQEGMFVYGDKACFEWGFADSDLPYVTTFDTNLDASRRGQDTRTEIVEMPNAYEMLPEALWPFTVGKDYDPLRPQESLRSGAGGGHHGSHPHLVHEFVRCIAEDREPWINFEMGANITAAGICAHMSAMADGKEILIPDFK